MVKFEKCIKCDRIGISCVPNLWLLPWPDLMEWCIKRQKHLGWTNQEWAEKSTTPVGTINRLKAGDTDCKYSTIRNMAIALIGGTRDEFSCTAQVEKELQQIEQLERQAALLATVEKENAALRQRVETADEVHRQDVRAIRAEYREQICFLQDELKAWRSWHQKSPGVE